MLVLAQVFEGEEVATGVIENAVDDYAQAPPVTLLHQLEEELIRRRPFPTLRIVRFRINQREITFRVGTEEWIDVVIRAAVVFVQRARVKNGIEVDRVNSEIDDVIQLLDYSCRSPP